MDSSLSCTAAYCRDLSVRRNKMDYISISVVGTVVSTPIRRGKTYSFELENRRGDTVSAFHVIVRNEDPIDVNKGDRVFISNAGFFERNGINNIAVIETSNLEVIRIRCNLGIEEV